MIPPALRMTLVSSGDPRWRTAGIGSEDSQVILGMTKYGSRDYLKRQLHMKLMNLEQSSADWHVWRDAGIGGSDSGAVMGMNPYRSREQVFDEKVERVSLNGDNENTRRGKELEPEARRRYESLFGWTMKPVCVLHDDYPFIRASLDGLREDHQLVLEIKCPTPANHLKTIANGLPDYYFCQVQHQLLIVGAPLAHFVSFCPKSKGKQLHVQPVEADKEFQEILLTELVRFWDEVQEELGRK
jgi:putative phage-type endonuclease